MFLHNPLLKPTCKIGDAKKARNEATLTPGAPPQVEGPFRVEVLGGGRMQRLVSGPVSIPFAAGISLHYTNGSGVNATVRDSQIRARQPLFPSKPTGLLRAAYAPGLIKSDLSGD